MNKNIIVILALAGSVGLSGCGASPTLAKYSGAKFERCIRSISRKEEQAARSTILRVGLIPFAGPFMMEEALYKEYEKICKRKGIL